MQRRNEFDGFFARGRLATVSFSSYTSSSLVASFAVIRVDRSSPVDLLVYSVPGKKRGANRDFWTIRGRKIGFYEPETIKGRQFRDDEQIKKAGLTRLMQIPGRFGETFFYDELIL